MSAHILAPIEQPASAAAGELVATCARVIFEGEEGESIIIATPLGDKIIIEGGAGSIEEGETYRLLGAYTNNPQHGRQFRATTWMPHASHDERGVIKYLSTHCDGIGKAIAKRIWDAYLHDAVKAVRENHSEVADALKIDPLMLRGAAEALEAIKQHEKVTVDLHSLLSGRGFGASAVAACIRRWGALAAVQCRRNPFSLLLAGIPRAGFKNVDQLYLALGGVPTALKRQVLAGLNEIQNAESGSTWHPKMLFERGIYRQCGEGKGDAARSLRLATTRRWGRGPSVAVRGSWLADPVDAAAEAELAACVARLFDGHPARWPAVSPPAVSQHQADRWNEQREHPLMLVEGPPGVGKTTLIAAVAKSLCETYGERCIAVAAPTGKAGRRITQGLHAKSLSLEATTEHRLLGVSRNGRDGSGWGFRYNCDNPLPVQFLIVDEWSMNDLRLSYNLFSALPPGCNVCLVGDEAQLPPVGGGAVLRDMLAARLPTVHLTVPMRNGGLIGKALESIKAGGPVEFCENLDPASGQNLKFIECASDVEQLAVLNIVLKAIQAKSGVSMSRDVVVLTPRNEGSRIARKPLNEYLGLLFNPHHPMDTTGKAEGFRIRDRVVCRSNTFTDAMAFTPGMDISDVNSYRVRAQTIYDECKIFVANGDVGYIVAVSKVRPEVIVRFDDPARWVKWRLGGKPLKSETTIGGKKEDLQLAWCLSGHLFQGSESNWVILMVDDGGGRVASKEYWYTSIGRGRTAVILIGKRAAFEKQRGRAELPGRKTFLKELLLEKMDDGTEGADGAGVVGDMVEVGAEV